MSKRHSLLALVTAMAAMLAIALTGAPAQAAGFTPINVWNSSHCLDNPTSDQTKLQMWSCNGSSPQRWLEGFNTATGMFTFTNQNSGRCIAAPATGEGTMTVQFCDAGATNQQWNVYFADNPVGGEGWYDVWQNVASGLCMTTPSVGDGTAARATTCDPSDRYDRWHEQ
jgi:hypothetical protein